MKLAENGRAVKCVRCNGHGIVSTWSFGVKEPDECKDCGGSGSNWQYSGGAIAMFYGGPLVGRAVKSRASGDR